MSRQLAEQFILSTMTELAPGGENTVIYEKLFKTMSDDEFDSFMGKLESGEIRLAVITPNFGKTGITVENNLKLAEKLGHNFFQRILIEGDENTPSFMTPIPYMVVDLPLRRQAQLLLKKISIPEDNKVVNNLTGQPTGRSKGSKISLPEVQVMASMGLDRTLEEFMKYRGGDTKGFDAMNSSIETTGGVRLDAIKHLSSGVESTNTLRIFLKSMHLDNTLV